MVYREPTPLEALNERVDTLEKIAKLVTPPSVLEATRLREQRWFFFVLYTLLMVALGGAIERIFFP